MGVRFVGGAYMVGVPRRDMSDAELATLNDEVRANVLRSPLYERIPDSDVQTPRTDWRTAHRGARHG